MERIKKRMGPRSKSGNLVEKTEAWKCLFCLKLRLEISLLTCIQVREKDVSNFPSHQILLRSEAKQKSGIF